LCFAAVLYCWEQKPPIVAKVVDDGKKRSLVAVHPRLPDPKLGRLKFADPRPDTYPPRDADIVAFSFPGFEEPWDELCSASFLANGFDVGLDGLQLKAKVDTNKFRKAEGKFRNAEAAFQALMFWDKAGEFAHLSAEEALQQKHERRGQEDFDYAGYEDKWKGMMAVLQAKFKSGSKLEQALEKTGDAFLLNHSGRFGEDPVWSDNNDGEGTNWLGLQLMLLRDRRTGWKKWTKWIGTAIDLQTGERIHPEHTDPNAWQAAVRNAKSAVEQAMVKQLIQDEEDMAASDQPLLPADEDQSAWLAVEEERAESEQPLLPVSYAQHSGPG